MEACKQLHQSQMDNQRVRLTRLYVNIRQDTSYDGGSYTAARWDVGRGADTPLLLGQSKDSLIRRESSGCERPRQNRLH